MNNTLIKEVTFFDFCDSFSDTYKNNFSYEGKRALYDYLCDMAQDTGKPIELDTIALCCEYTEFDDLKDYGAQYDPLDTIEDIQNKTMYIPLEKSEGFIILNY
jgi:hypothetical protein